MIDLIISATVGAIAGSAIMRRIDLRKMADRDVTLRRELDLVKSIKDQRTAQGLGLLAAHSRATDRGNTLQARIDRALECETPKAARGDA